MCFKYDLSYLSVYNVAIVVGLRALLSVELQPFPKYTGWAKKPDHFLKCITFLYNDIGRHSIYQNV